MVKFRVNDENIDNVLAFQRVAQAYHKPLRVYRAKGKGGAEEVVVRTSGLRAKIADFFARAPGKKASAPQASVSASSEKDIAKAEKYDTIFSQAQEKTARTTVAQGDFKKSFQLAPRETLAMLRKSNSDLEDVIKACMPIKDEPSLNNSSVKKDLEQILFSKKVSTQYLQSSGDLREQYEQLANIVNPDRAKTVIDQRTQIDHTRIYAEVTAAESGRTFERFEEAVLAGNTELAEQLNSENKFSYDQLKQLYEKIEEKVKNLDAAYREVSSTKSTNDVEQLTSRRTNLELMRRLLLTWIDEVAPKKQMPNKTEPPSETASDTTDASSEATKVQAGREQAQIPSETASDTTDASSEAREVKSASLLSSGSSAVNGEAFYHNFLNNVLQLNPKLYDIYNEFRNEFTKEQLEDAKRQLSAKSFRFDDYKEAKRIILQQLNKWIEEKSSPGMETE